MLAQKHTYATPFEVWSELEKNSATRPSILLSICEAVADFIDSFCRRHFALLDETRFYDRPERGEKLRLDADLLTLTTLTIGRISGTVWTEGTQFWAYPLNRTRKSWLQVEPGYSFRGETADVRKAISALGTWGYEQRLADETLVGTGGIDNSAATLPVTTGEGTDMDGQLLKVESERMYVTAAAANSVTVERGVLGTAKAAHIAGVSVQRVLPPADILRAAIVLSGRQYRAAEAGHNDEVGMDPVTGRFQFQRAIPADVRLVLEQKRRTLVA